MIFIKIILALAIVGANCRPPPPASLVSTNSSILTKASKSFAASQRSMLNDSVGNFPNFANDPNEGRKGKELNKDHKTAIAKYDEPTAFQTVEKKVKNLENVESYIDEAIIAAKALELLNMDQSYDEARKVTLAASNMTSVKVIPNPNDSSLSLAVQTAEKKDRNLDDFEDLVSFYVKSFLIGNCENFVKTTDIRTFFKA